jgi:hypothetical protein
MNPAKRYLAFPLTLFETGIGSKPTSPKLFLSSLINVSAGTDSNLKGPPSCRSFNRCEGIIIPDLHSLTCSLFQFIDTTFEKAKPNVRINGKKFDDLKDEDDGTLSLVLDDLCTLS